MDKKEDKTYDLIIVGAGPAGLTASIYATRRLLKTLIISMDVGGQVALTGEVENYPGFELITGFELSEKFKKQAEKWGAEFAFDEVVKVEKKDGFTVKTKKEKYKAKAIIFSFGLTPRKLNVPGEEEFKGKGVTYCATCDGPLYKNKTIAIVGGGNSAMEAAVYLSTLAKKVYLIHRSDEFQSAAHLLDRSRKLKNIEFYCHTQIKEIKGDKKVTSAIITNTKNKTEEELKLDGVFIEIGYESKSQWLKGLVKLNQKGEIITNRDAETSEPGIFAAGDCSDAHYKQIVISSGEGAKASLQAYKYIVENGGGKAAPDWGKCELVGTDKTVKIKLED